MQPTNAIEVQRICKNPACSEIVTGSLKQVYCSKKCNREHWYILNPRPKYLPEQRICLNCPNEFTTKRPNDKFCSVKCYTDYWNKKTRKKKIEYIKCAESDCSNTFKKAGDKKKYCSVKCQVRARRKKHGQSVLILTLIKCENCGIPFNQKTAHQRFCTKKCNVEFTRNRKTHGICIECGKPFERKKHKQLTCSDACADLNNKNNKAAHRRYNYIDAKALNGKHKSAFTKQQQQEIANIIGIGIARIGNIDDLRADNCLQHIYENIIKKLLEFNLYRHEIKHIYRSCLIVMDIIRNHKSNNKVKYLSEDIFKEMRSDFTDRVDKIYNDEL